MSVRVSVRRATVAAALLSACACGCTTDPTDPLDASIVSELSKQVGDALGIEPSGVYSIELTPESCGCADVNASLSSLTLCQGAMVGRGGLGGLLTTTLDVVVSDGIIDLGSERTTSNPVGPLEADGFFDAGAVTRLTSLATTGALITRVDGSLTPTALGGYAIEGQIRMRLRGEVELLGFDGVLTEVEELDCTESVLFEGERYIVR